MNDERNRQPDDAAAPGSDIPPARGGAQHADLYDVPPTPQREAPADAQASDAGKAVEGQHVAEAVQRPVERA
jgi:hypothetical protein